MKFAWISISYIESKVPTTQSKLTIVDQTARRLSTLVLLILFLIYPASPSEAQEVRAPTRRRVNVPYLENARFTPAIIWFGKIDSSNNNADVRIAYYDNSLYVDIHIIDRWLRYDTAPSVPELTQYDSLSLYLNTEGVSGSVPASSAFRFDAQVVWYEPQENYQASYQGDGSVWNLGDIPITLETGWRGGGVPNDALEDKGWNVSFIVPFTSLGLSGPPIQGSQWGLGIVLHDRDDINSPPLVDTKWPETMNPDMPITWGELHFGIPTFKNLPALPIGTSVIRHGLDGVNVSDGHVGGHTLCGGNLDHWNEWGNANYAGYSQINVQNQWDISDWPCFSKYFITFPLNKIPPGQSIISATLSMHMFGNAGGGVWGTPPDSYIQALVVDRDWDEATLTWNNAPLAVENISGTWVYPMTSPEWELYTWDVSRAVAQAYGSGEPLRLALYSADGERHTGKYFLSSDISDYDAAARPTLTIQWGNLCDTPRVQCTTVHLPLISAP